MGSPVDKLHEPLLDFSNTEIAFADKSNKDLRKIARLFKVMNASWLVSFGSSFALLAIKLKIPFVPDIIRKTIFTQFIGGTTLLESQKAIDDLFKRNTLTILDYGAEAKHTEKDFNHTMTETIRAMEFANKNVSVPVISTKISGLARFGLLESIQSGQPFTRETRREYRAVLKRIDSICHVANEKGVGVFFDAEESWIQNTIDHLVILMMKRYNKKRVVVYNTFQMYRKDRLQFLFDSFSLAEKDNYLLGAKLVRGAYMEKERARAEELGYNSPIHESKEATDDSFNTGLRFCIDNYESIGYCNATHNVKSNQLMADLIHSKGLEKNHPHLNFCQLLGMSDLITFNLADAGYNVAKYVPYGTVKEIVPYLIRRAQENTAIAGDVSRELKFIQKELARRKISI